MKMVVTDLDGTLLRSDRTISERTLNAIRTLQGYGIKFVIATARAPRSVMKLLPFDFSDIYSICYNGAAIYKNNELIYEKHIEADSAAYIVDWFMRKYPKINISLEISNQLYTNFDISIMKGWIPPYCQVDFKLFEFKPSAKILVDLREIQYNSEILEMLPDSCSMMITDSGTLGQIAHADVSKVNGIRNLAGILEYKMDEIIAFGDDFNDLDMIVECGTGVAMGNSPDEVKRVANVVTLSNDDEGVAIEMEKLFGDEKKLKAIK